MRVSVKLWEASHRQRPLKVMIAVITPPFTPAHTQSLPSTLIQSEKQFHCWKLKMNFAFLGIRWSRCILKCLQDTLFTFPVRQFLPKLLLSRRTKILEMELPRWVSRTPSEHCQITFEQGAQPSNSGIEPWMSWQLTEGCILPSPLCS